MEWKKMLSYVTGSVDQELLLRNEYLLAENRILRNQIQGRLRLNDSERKSLAEIGVGRKALDQVTTLVKPETILAWHRRLVAKKFDGSIERGRAGRPATDPELEQLIIRLARENRDWGYDRIQGAVQNLGYTVSDQTVGNMRQVARNVTMADVGFLTGCRYLLHDRDTKFSRGFDPLLSAAGVEAVRLPARSPNLNAIRAVSGRMPLPKSGNNCHFASLSSPVPPARTDCSGSRTR